MVDQETAGVTYSYSWSFVDPATPTNVKEVFYNSDGCYEGEKTIPDSELDLDNFDVVPKDDTTPGNCPDTWNTCWSWNECYEIATAAGAETSGDVGYLDKMQ